MQVLFASMLLFTLNLSISVLATAQNRPYPIGPDPRVTPGALCKFSTVRRYPENIFYCERDVDVELKEEVIRTYNRQFGYRIDHNSRALFKIDHLIPLCAGGANVLENLWPQHVSVYKITDSLEPAICAKMATGHLRQAEAIKLIIAGKSDPKKIPQIFQYLSRL